MAGRVEPLSEHSLDRLVANVLLLLRWGHGGQRNAVAF